MTKKPEKKMLNVRVTRNLLNRVHRVSSAEGITQTAFVLRALERELIRSEKEYTKKFRARQEFLDALEKNNSGSID